MSYAKGGKLQVMHGMKDPMIDGVHPHHFEKEIKDAVLYTIADGKHNIHLRYAKEFHAAVLLKYPLRL